MKNGNQDLDKMNKLQEEYSNLISDEKIRQYFEAETKFNVVIADVNKIIAEAVREVL